MKRIAICVAAITLLPLTGFAQSAYRSSYSHQPFRSSAYSAPRQQSFNQSSYSTPVHVSGYVKTDGSYVQPHYRSSADSNPYNNYSTKGNTNPYTGQEGTVDPYGY